MTTALASVLALLGIVIVMFALDRPRMDAVALIVICTLPLTGVVEMSEALAGFSDPNIVLVAAMFVIGNGLVRTGVASYMGDWLVARAGQSETRLVVLLMIVVCCLGATMSSTAVTAIFIPVVLRICRSTGTAPGRLMMPLSAGALISGMMTLVATTPNLVVNSALVRRGEPGFHFFSFTPFGVPILGLGILYMLIARRWLPSNSRDGGTGRLRRPSLADWVERYKLLGREHRLRIDTGSPLAGQTLESVELCGATGINLVAIERDRSLIQPMAKTELRVGDILLVDTMVPDLDVAAMQGKYALEVLPLTVAHFLDRSQEIGMAELFVPADSELIGKTIVQAGIRTRFGISVIGLRRGVQAIEQGLLNEELRIGDTLLVIGPWKAIRNVQIVDGHDLHALNWPAEMDDVLPVTGRAVPAVLTLMLVVGLMISGVIPNVQAALIGCLLMGALGCIDFESAYRAIEWKTLILIVGMLPFSLALQRTGGVEWISGILVGATQGLGAYGILAVLFAATALLGLFISNTATAVLMAPIALAAADRIGASPYPFAMLVSLAASAAFMTPVSSPVNTLVVTPGGYRFRDFVRVGVPFALIVMIVVVLMVPWLLPLW